jgi:Flp pilus assembly protein TadD
VKAKPWIATLAGVTAVLLVTAVACSRDSNLPKQKYLESGKRYFARGNYRAAAIQFTNAIRIDPNFGEGHDLLAQSYLKMEDWSDAYQELSRTIELQPDNYRAQVDLIKLLTVAGQFRAAQDKASALLKKNPTDPQAHALIANALAAQGNIAAATREIETAVSLAPNESGLRISLGVLEIKANQLDKAEATFKKAAQMDPHSVSPLIALGGYYLQFKRFAEAQQVFLQAKKLEPTNPEIWSDLARVQLAQGNRAEAENILQQAKLALYADTDGYRLLGDFYLATNQTDRALSEYASLYRDHPDDLAVQKNYIQVLIIRGQLQEAAKLDENLLKKHHNDPDGLLYKGQILNGQGRFTGAVQALEALLNNSPDNAMAHYHLGVALAGLGNSERAEVEWRQAVSTRPELVDAQTALAMVAMRKGDMHALAFIGDQVVHYQPSLPNGYLLRATAETNLNRFAAAEADLREARQLAPETAGPYVQTGHLRLAQGRVQDARACYEQALKADPTSLEALRGLVDLYLREKQPDEALARLEAQTSEANTGGYHYLRAVALLNKQDLAAGELELQQAIALDKSNVEAIEALARVEMARGAAGQAIAVYQKAVEDNPGNDHLYVNLGSLLEAQGNMEAAEQSYTKALQVRPDSGEAANDLAYLLLKKGDDLGKALALAQQARRTMPNSPNAADTLGWAFFKRGQYSQAAALFAEAAARVPKNPTYQYHLGMAYQGEKHISEARLHLERVLKMDPNYENASDVRRALAQLESPAAQP